MKIQSIISQQPYGKVLMIVIVAGLIGYSLWGFVRALLDPLGRGTDTKGLTARAGYLLSDGDCGIIGRPDQRSLHQLAKRIYLAFA